MRRALVLLALLLLAGLPQAAADTNCDYVAEGGGRTGPVSTYRYSQRCAYTTDGQHETRYEEAQVGVWRGTPVLMVTLILSTDRVEHDDGDTTQRAWLYADASGTGGAFTYEDEREPSGNVQCVYAPAYHRGANANEIPFQSNLACLPIVLPVLP